MYKQLTYLKNEFDLPTVETCNALQFQTLQISF